VLTPKRNREDFVRWSFDTFVRCLRIARHFPDQLISITQDGRGDCFWGFVSPNQFLSPQAIWRRIVGSKPSMETLSFLWALLAWLWDSCSGRRAVKLAFRKSKVFNQWKLLLSNSRLYFSSRDAHVLSIQPRTIDDTYPVTFFAPSDFLRIPSEFLPQSRPHCFEDLCFLRFHQILKSTKRDLHSFSLHSPLSFTFNTIILPLPQITSPPRWRTTASASPFPHLNQKHSTRLDPDHLRFQSQKATNRTNPRLTNVLRLLCLIIGLFPENSTRATTTGSTIP
jgi:hypothetical protein